MQVSTGVIRRDGRLELISGRHRFAKMMEDDKVEAHMCYVFIEDETHDLKWATMLDYENNMRDDQADEKTAAVYIRTIPQSDGELYRKGLLRNATKSKRGIFIGKQARQNLFDLFMDDKVSPKDAEIICQLTQNLTDEARIEEIQSRAASLLKEGKSWEYIGGMTQLLANKEKVTLKQGLLDLGADFQADLDKMARCIEQNMKALQNAIKLLKMGKKLSKDNRKEAERLGVIATTSEDNAGKMEALTRELKRWEYIGSYPDLIAAVQMWDGETKQDPVGKVMEQYEREKAEAGEQQRAEEMVPEEQGGFDFSASMVEMNEARERYAGTEAAKAVEKVVTSLRGKVKDAVTRAELEERVPVEERKGLISQEEELIMPANEGVIDAVKAATGRDVTGYYHAVSEDRLWHAILHHGQDSTSTQHVGQLDLTWDDFALLPDILDTGTPEVKSYPKSDTIIEYTKDYNGVVYKVRQRVGRKRRFHESKLSFVTEWIEKRRGSQGVSPDHVQGHSLGFPRDAIQSQGGGDVKGEVSGNAEQLSGNSEQLEGESSMSVRNLAAVHTLSVEKFLAAGKMGGMPLPSVAVTRLDRPYGMIDGVDKIVLVGRPEMVDPERGAHVWSKDAWTGMFPKVTRKLTKAGRDAMRDLYYKMGRYDLKSDVYDGRRLAYYRDKFYDAWQKGETPGDMMAMLRSEDGHYIARMLFGMEMTGWNGALNEAFAYAHTHDEEFKGWLDEVEGKWFGKLMIEGTRKEATLENVTAWMLRNKKRNEERGWNGVSFGTGNARAAVAQRLGSMEEVKARREMLTDSESSDKEKGENDDMIEHVFDMFFAMPHAEGEEAVEKMQERAQRYFEALGSVKGEPTEEKVEKELRKAFANDEQMTKMGVFVTQGVLVLKYLREEAEDYLEAVPQRAVRMDEWVYAVMSKGASQREEVQRVCRENGITPIVVGASGKERALGDLIDDGEVSFSVTDAKERGLFKDGVMEVENGVLVDGGTDFSASVDFSHVSPALYRRPDKEHVGTGEGNQVYGWGVLYGAESPVVNRSYHRQFTRHGGYFVQGLTRERKRLKREDVLAGLRAHGVWRKQNLDEADSLWYAPSKGAMMGVMEEAKEEVKKWENWVRIAEERKDDLMKMQAVNKLEYWKQEVLVADYFVENDILVERGEVRYPVNYRMRADVDDGNLLHWDEPAAKMFEEDKSLLYYYRQEGCVFEWNETGREVYNELVRMLGSARAASEWLDAHGIRGVKYADGMTRKKEGNKTYNYVIFNPDYVEVIAINNRHEWSEYSEDNPDWQRPEDVDFSASVRNLAAVHTIDQDDFINAADELGGMPLPSVAVTRLDRPYSWGDDETSVTLVARPDMVDPRRGTDVYSRDAWTGRMPMIESEEDGEDLRTFFYDEEGEKVDATLENLTDYLYGRKRRGNEATERELDLTWTARAYLARRMRDMEDVKGQRERLQGEDEVRVLSEDIGKWMDMLHEYDVWLGDEEWIGVFEALADVDEVTEESVREAIMNFGGTDGWADLSALQNSEAMEEGSRFIAETVRIMKELRAEKTDYLEAVPQRAVRMNEWVYALFSDKVGNKESVRRACEENGIIPIEYKAGERDKALGDLIDDGEVSFSVIGEHARTWGRYKERAFAGRDDGKMRAEIDASKARLTDRAKMLLFWPDHFARWVAEVRGAGADKELRKAYREATRGRKYDAEAVELVGRKLVEDAPGDIRAFVQWEGEYENVAKAVYEAGMLERVSAMEAVKRKYKLNGSSKKLVLGDVLDYPELYEAYPQLRDYAVAVSSKLGNARGEFYRALEMIQLSIELKNEQEVRSTLLHEVQHAIQGIEGFARGGYESEAARLARERGMEREGLSEYDYYLRMAGEIEARNVQARKDMSARERLERGFNETLEFPGEAIVDFSASAASRKSIFEVDANEARDFAQRVQDVFAAAEKPKKGFVFKLCSYPEVMKLIFPWEGDVVIRWDNLEKLQSKHGMTPEQIGKLPAELCDPIAIFEDNTKERDYVVVTELEAPARDGKMRKVAAILKLRGTRPGVIDVTFVSSAYARAKDDTKYAGLLKNNRLRYLDKARAGEWVSLEETFTSQLLTTKLAEPDSGVILKDNVADVKGDFSAYVANVDVKQRVWDIMTGRYGDAEGEQVAKEWERFLRMFSLSSVGEDEREAGRMLGKMLALVAATRRVLPENFKGGLHGLALQAAWLRWYAQMAETGQVTRSTELSGKVYERVRERLLMQHEREQLSYTEEEAMELLRRYAGQKMGTVVESMARGCRRQVEVYLREKMRQDMLAAIERLYPKREPGEHWKRGRATGETYRYAEVVKEFTLVVQRFQQARNCGVWLRNADI